MTTLGPNSAPFIPSADDLRPFAAEICLIGGIAANLIVPFATRRPNFVCAAVTLAALLFGVICLMLLGNFSATSTTQFHGFLVSDSVACTWKLILLLFVAGVVVMWRGNSGRSLRQGDAPEFFTLLLGSTLGMCLMASTTHLLMIVMAVAMASLPSYLLAGYRKGNRRAAEASLKYVLFGAVTGAMMTYGITFIYGLYGTLQLTDLAGLTKNHEPWAALSLAMVGLIIGIGFKISAVPLHFWCPDVFEGSTIEVTTFLSVASKGAALILLWRILEAMAAGHIANQLAVIVGVLGAITATVGNVAAFSQINIKRLLAYSSIAQAGYMMCVLSSVGHGNPASIAQALLLYLMIYAVMNLGAFAITAVVIRQSGGGETLKDFAGLARSSPLLAGAFLCCLISLIGLPPFAGFGAKVNVLWILAQAGPFGACLVAVVVLNTALSAFYYFRIVRVMYLEQPTDSSSRQWTHDPLGVVIGSVCAGGLILMFFGFGVLYSVTGQHLSTATVHLQTTNVLRDRELQIAVRNP